MRVTHDLEAGAGGSGSLFAPPAVIEEAALRGLAGFRYQVRRFFAFSSEALQAEGVSPVQYQAMLAIGAHDGDEPISTSELADQLFIRRHTATELGDRLAKAGLVERDKSRADRRRTLLRLTDAGTAALSALALLHLEQHRRQMPALLQALSQITGLDLPYA